MSQLRIGFQIRDLGRFVALGLFLCGAFCADAAEAEVIVSPSPATSPIASPSPATPAAASSPSTSSLSTAEQKSLLREFKRAQFSELQALRHRHRLEARELRASHRAKIREWEAKEKTARHEYFAANPKGRERRAYVKDYKQRYEDLRSTLEAERKQREREREEQANSLRQKQARRLKEFRSYLDRGEQPPSELWPDRGG